MSALPASLVGTWREWVQPVAEAARRVGLDPCETEFHEVPADLLYDVAAYGLPGMYAHWSFGQARWRSKGEFDVGLSKIHELVTHTLPAHAYLLDHNSLSEHLFVMAHVMGHSDFFRRNALMQQARTDMVPLLREASARFVRYETEQGMDAVEAVLDLGHALMWHVCPLPERRPDGERRRPQSARGPYADLPGLGPGDRGTVAPPSPSDGGPKAPAARDPHGSAARRRQESLQEQRRARWGTPLADPLAFLIAHAPLEEWERDMLQVVREVGMHYRPQIRTKVMNEGWAVRACLKILDALDLPAEADMAVARLHAQVAHGDPLHLNPYWLGWRLFEHLEQSGQDVFAICEMESDVSFLSNWVDAAFVRRERLYNWDAVEDNDPRVGRSLVLRETTRQWERVRDRLVAAHVPPIPSVVVADVAADGTLQLALEDSRNVDQVDAQRIVRGMARLWRGPVELRRAAAPEGGGRGPGAAAGQPGPAGARPGTADAPICSAGPLDPDPEEEEETP